MTFTYICPNCDSAVEFEITRGNKLRTNNPEFEDDEVDGPECCENCLEDISKEQVLGQTKR